MINTYLEEDMDDRKEFMQSRRERAINTIAKGLQTDFYSESLARSIAFAYKNDLECALNLVQSLLLRQSDMFAILDDEDGFWEAYATEL